MFDCELIVGTGTDAVSLDLYNDLPLSVNFNIADIKEPDKRNGDYTKTIKLKGTKTNNQFFEQTYDVNIKTNTWNPNIKTSAYFLKSGTVPMKGDMRLMSIDVIRKNEFEDITYNVVLLGRNANIFTTIGDAKLEDLDLSTYNHNFTYAKQNAAESNIIDVAGTPTTVANGVGYRYPLIDYGYNSWASNYYHVNHLRPAIFAKTYWDAIFAAAGKTYTSSFLTDTSDLFCKDLILHNGDKLTMSTATRATREFYAGMSGVGTTLSIPLIYGGTGGWYNNTMPLANTNRTCVWNDDTNSPFIDTPSMYNVSTGIFIIQDTGWYTVQGLLDAQMKATAPAGTVTVTGSVLHCHAKLVQSTNSGATWTQVDDTFFQTAVTPISSSFQNLVVYNLSFLSSMYFGAGTWLRVEFHPVTSIAVGVRFYDGSSNEITSGTGVTVDWRLNTPATINCKLSSAELTEGLPLVMNDSIPKDIKQKDFLLSMIKKYNLYIDIDKSDPNNYIIEPRDDFYAAGTTIDWSDKYAVDKTTQIKPMGEINIKTFSWKYKQDTDYVNKLYQDSYSEPYGTKTYDIANDFVKGENKNELIFSPTPVLKNTANDLIIPKIFSWDGTTVKPMKHNLRSVYWRGSVAVTNTWTYGSVSGNVGKTTFQGVAMVDDPLAPTESMEFGVPNEVYYDGIATTYTTNNLFSRFYAKQIEELTDRDSKIVTLYVKLDPQDISKFDFRDRIFIDKSYYFVNKIFDYNPLKDDLTKVELVKLKAGTIYTPAEAVSSSTVETNIGGTGLVSRSGASSPFKTTYGDGNAVVVGENMTNRTSGGVIASGRNSSVGEGCYLINMISSTSSHVGVNASSVTMYNVSGCFIGASANKIVLANCDNVNLSELIYDYVGVGVRDKNIGTNSSNMLEIGYPLSNPTIISQTKTESFNVSPNISLYYINVSGANIVATFNFNTTANKSVTFIRVDSGAGTFSITNTTGSATLQGSAAPIDLGMTQWDSFTIHNDGSNFYII